MSESQNSICSDDAEEKMVDIQVEQQLEFIGIANYKDALLTSLYSQVDFLKHELEEKKLLIWTLIIKESEVYKYYDRSMIDSETTSSYSSSTQETINETSIYTDTPTLSAKDNISGIHVAKDNIPGIHVTKDNIPGIHVRKDNIPGIHVRRDNIPGIHVTKDNIPAIHVTKDNIPGIHVTKDNIPGIHVKKDNIPG